MISLKLPGSFNSRISSRLGAVLLVVVSSIGSWQNLRGVPVEPETVTQDRYPGNFHRFDALRDAMPAYIPGPGGRVGYVTDVDTDVWRFLAQYSLAPLVVTPGRPFPAYLLDPRLRGVWQRRADPIADLKWYVGDFHSEATVAAILQRDGLVVVRDFGGGIKLLKRVRQ